MARKYLLYDERAMSGDTDDATVFTVSDSIEEAREDAEMFGNCVVYSYEDNNGTLVDELFEEYILG